MTKIVVIQGHPDPDRKRLCHALADAYMVGARAARHQVDYVDIGELDFPILRTQEEWGKGIKGTPDSLRAAQRAIMGANHLVFIYPLWLGTMPALLKAFLEQVFRPDVAVKDDKGALKPLFNGKTARVIVTMGMPALVYRWYFLAHSLKSLERNILGSSGVRPIRTTIFGSVDKAGATGRAKWLEKVKSLGGLAR